MLRPRKRMRGRPALGHPLPDPTLSPPFWSDSVLQVLYDAIHAVALTTTGATSLMHEAKVDIVTVPNLSEHQSSAETTQQLSARFAYAAAMKSINNLLLLGDGETWSRQSVDFGGLPEMVRTFLQVAAGAADMGPSSLGSYPAIRTDFATPRRSTAQACPCRLQTACNTDGALSGGLRPDIACSVTGEDRSGGGARTRREGCSSRSAFTASGTSPAHPHRPARDGETRPAAGRRCRSPSTATVRPPAGWC